jgi:hypothetical protein
MNIDINTKFLLIVLISNIFNYIFDIPILHYITKFINYGIILLFIFFIILLSNCKSKRFNDLKNKK